MRLLLGTLALLIALVGCSEAGVTSADMYKIGCPAVDAVAGGGSLASDGTVAALRALRNSGQLDPAPEAWLDEAIAFLISDDPSATTTEAKGRIIEGCAGNGYPLRNLS